MEDLIHALAFWFFAALAVISALCVVSLRNPVSGAVSLVIAFVAVAGLYLTLGAIFVAAVQILVYAGAIMVLFLFVIMLLNLEVEPREEPGVTRLLGAALAFAFLFAAAAFLFANGPPAGESIRGGSAREVGELFANEYLFPFEAASVLLLVAMVGAIVIGRRRRPSDTAEEAR